MQSLEKGPRAPLSYVCWGSKLYPTLPAACSSCWNPVAVTAVSSGHWPVLGLQWPSLILLAETGLSLTFISALDLPVALGKQLSQLPHLQKGQLQLISCENEIRPCPEKHSDGSGVPGSRRGARAWPLPQSCTCGLASGYFPWLRLCSPLKKVVPVLLF